MNKIQKLYTKNLAQVKMKFDTVTIKKIARGALIAGTGSVALYLLDYVGGLEFTNTNIAALVSFSVPFLVNVVKEYISGE